MRMRYRFFIADVFTEQPFAGNQLAVFPDAAGLSDRAMQAIAREFNFPESTFVLPPADSRHAARVRIFTPTTEMPFAGHPTVGTSAVLARLERMPVPGTGVLELNIGPTPVELTRRGAHVHAALVMDKPVELGPKVSNDAAAAALSVPVEEAWVATAGVRFCFARLKDRATVDRAVLDRAGWARDLDKANLYFFAADGENLYVRMFAPALGIEEDPATGSGAVGIAGVLAARNEAPDGVFTWRIDQGVAMGRPSRIEASAEKRGGKVVRIKVGGATVISAEGTMEVPSGY
jgi:trans-2,3-dihydro-3-hydroxyanthranilate isomerase